MTFKQTAGTGAGGTQNEVFIPQLAQRYTLLFGQRMIDRNGYAQRIGVQQDGSEMRGGDIALDDRQIRLEMCIRDRSSSGSEVPLSILIVSPIFMPDTTILPSSMTHSPLFSGSPRSETIQQLQSGPVSYTHLIRYNAHRSSDAQRCRQRLRSCLRSQ